MSRDWLMVGVNFAVLLLLQVFVCNAVYLGIYLNIQIYLMFILFLPANFSRLLVLFLSAIMGLSVDLLSGDLGLHMAACTAMGYVRPYLLKRITTTTTGQIEIPPLNRTHLGQYYIYTGILITLHHLLLFTLETFELREIPFILTRTIVSASCNIVLISLAVRVKN
ncbi:MAG: rod shape-determining protein MreD [Prevotellaceae bacterium]|jgi:rod shape-determining protein MreD|nr:rod shape-determining protein MreD [Prevotellaceae bacterium]